MAQKYFVEVKQGGHTFWHRDPEMKILHRLDGPAVERPGVYRAWLQNGKLHRLGGPAVEWVSGSRHWYQDGYLHRLDGPAIENPNGDVEYWIDGKKYTARSFNREVKARLSPKEMTVAELEAALGHPVKIIK